MRIPPRWVAAACLAMVTPLLGQQTLVNFVPTELNIPGSNYLQAAHDSASVNEKTWNFDLDTPVFNTWVPVYGGVKITNNGGLLNANGSYLRAQDALASGVAPSIYLFSSAGGNGTTVNTVDAAFLWKRQDFTNSTGARVVFTANSTLSVNVLNWNSTAAVPGQIRFLVKNGSQYYISEASRSTAGTLTLTDFNGNATAGKRWAPFNPTATSFGLPASPTGFQAVTFDDVQAVGWIGRGARAYSGTYVFDAFSATGSTANNDMAVAVNLSSVSDFNTYQPFKNVFKAVRSWQTRNSDNTGKWHSDLADEIPRDEFGWPLVVPFDQPYGAGLTHPRHVGDPAWPLTVKQIVHTTWAVVKPGSYRLRFNGTGTFWVRYQTSATTSATQNFTPTSIANLPTDASGKRYWDTPSLATYPGEGGVPMNKFFMEIKESGGTTYLRDFDLITPGHFSDDLQAEPFNPDFLAHATSWGQVIRFMDWGRTNGSGLSSWTQRTRPQTYTQATRTVALEYMIQLSNTLNRHLWICLPHQADATFIEKTAKVVLNGARADGEPFDPVNDAPAARVYAGLNPGLKVFVEYSNETWNTAPAFSQTTYCVNQARALRTAGMPFDANDTTAGHQYAAYQSAQIWQTFYNVFGATASDRVVRIMAAQAGNASVATARMNAFSVANLITVPQYPDAVAIAPYFANSVGNQIVDEGVVATISDADLLARIRTAMETTTTSNVANHRQIADQFGVYLTTYETGQHLVGVGSAYENNATLTSRLTSINRHPGMKPIYADYLTMMNNFGVVTSATFSDIGVYGKFGSWGVRESLYLPAADAPKFQAHLDFIAARPRTNVNPLAAFSVPDSVVDADNNGSEVVALSAVDSVDYDGSIASVVWRINRTAVSGKTANVTLPVGEHQGVLTVVDNGGAVTQAPFTVRVRPQGSDTVVVRSSFAGATAPGLSRPWTATAVLNSGVTQSGWNFVTRTGTNWGITGGANVLDAFGITVSYTNTGARTTLAEAVTFNQYVELTVTPNAGRSLDMRSGTIKFTVRASDGSAPRRAALMTSLTGFADGAQIFTSPQIATGSPFRDTEFTVGLPFTSTYQNVTGPLTIRIYFYDNLYAGKIVSLSGFELQSAVR